MRILLLSDIYSEHTEKWALSLAKSGVTVGLFSFNKASYNWYENVPNIELLFQPEVQISGSGLKEKLSYFKLLPVLKGKIKQFRPDLLHAHYATSYGLIGAMSGFKPFVVSVWGSDVYDFPKQNFIYKRILKYALSKATAITSTSNCMKVETLNYTEKAITVVPFGIDINMFNRSIEQQSLSNSQKIVIGSIKPLGEKYGTGILIDMFSQVVKRFPDRQFSLCLVGEGPKQDEYVNQVRALGIEKLVDFTGRVAFNEISNYHKKIDIFVSLSVLNSESFGVSLVEAMASKSIVVATDVDGFKEVLGGNNDCGFLIQRNSVKEAVDAVVSVIENPDKALAKAEKARERAVALYNWETNVKQMINVYQKTLKA